MVHGKPPDRQLSLFLTRLAWHELPSEVRQDVIQLLAHSCADIIAKLHPEPQEQPHDPTED